MKLYNPTTLSPSSCAFTLVESLVVISIIAIVTAVIVPSVMSSRNKNALSDAQNSLIRALESVRSRAQSGGVHFGGVASNQGIHIKTDGVELFEGNDYAAIAVYANLPFPASIVSDQATPLNIIFSRIVGTSKKNTGGVDIIGDASIKLTHSTGANSTITITQQGTIIAN